MKVFDNIIPKKEQDSLKKFLLSRDISWFYQKDISYVDNNLQSQPGFAHHFIKDGVSNSPFVEKIMPLVKSAAKKIGLEKVNIFYARAFLQLPLNQKFINYKSLATPHIDTSQDHLVLLYYVLDSNGDTVIYDYKTYDQTKVPDQKKLKVLKRVTPKQGRLLIFNGAYWHCSTLSTNNVRAIINIDIKTPSQNILKSLKF